MPKHYWWWILKGVGRGSSTLNFFIDENRTSEVYQCVHRYNQCFPVVICMSAVAHVSTASNMWITRNKWRHPYTRQIWTWQGCIPRPHSALHGAIEKHLKQPSRSQKCRGRIMCISDISDIALGPILKLCSFPHDICTNLNQASILYPALKSQNKTT